MQNLPKLQLALDNLDLQSALSAIQKTYAHIDVIEVGTVLCLAEGMHAVRTMRTLYPNHLILADVRIIKAGGLIAKMCFEAGADWVSVMSDAALETVTAVISQAHHYNGDVQIELNDNWTLNQAHQWRELGINQVVLHRSHEANSASKAWQQSDFDTINTLTDMGFKVTVTGGVTVNDIPNLKQLPIFVIIAGRAIRNATDPLAAAQQFKEALLS